MGHCAGLAGCNALCFVPWAVSSLASWLRMDCRGVRAAQGTSPAVPAHIHVPASRQWARGVDGLEVDFGAGGSWCADGGGRG